MTPLQRSQVEVVTTMLLSISGPMTSQDCAVLHDLIVVLQAVYSRECPIVNPES